MLNDCVAVSAGELESVAFTVNDVVPACVGVPVMSPLVESASPAGSDPLARDHVYGAVPPVADRIAL